MKSIIGFAGAHRLQKYQLIEEGSDLKLILSETFRKKIPIKEIPDFDENYEATFGTFRSPDTLSIYAAKVSSLSDKRLHPIFGQGRFRVCIRKKKTTEISENTEIKNYNWHVYAY